MAWATSPSTSRRSSSFPTSRASPPFPQLIIASVSNWGGYGLVAGLSLLTGRNLLPSPEQEEDVIRTMVDRGAVDGVASAQVYAVDGFTLQENRRTLEALHRLLAERGVGE